MSKRKEVRRKTDVVITNDIARYVGGRCALEASRTLNLQRLQDWIEGGGAEMMAEMAWQGQDWVDLGPDAMRWAPEEDIHE